jgi:hypothetical protein
MKALVRSLLLLAVAGISVSGVLTWSAGSARGAGAPATGSPPALPSDGSEQAGDPRTLRACPLGAPQPDCGYHGLQGALAAALPGDRVVLAPGIYEEGAVIETPGLVLRGEPGAHLRDHAVEGKAALVVKATASSSRASSARASRCATTTAPAFGSRATTSPSATSISMTTRRAS